MAPRPFATFRGLALALAVPAILALGTSCSHDVPTAARAPTPSPPTASSPAGVVDLLQWSMVNRDLPHFEELFTTDFEFVFALTDSAGLLAPHGLTRDDMLICAQHLFDGGGAEPPAKSISLIFDNALIPEPDLRAGLQPRWHQQMFVSNLTLEIVTNAATAWRLTEGAMFYLVRGDSAAVPQDLLVHGIEPDSTRWFISRWEDETNVGVAPQGALRGIMASPAATLPTRQMTIGRLLLLYRQ